MEKYQVKRSEIKEEYTWDLTLIYESDDLWYDDFEKLKKEINKISSFKGNFTKSSDSLLEFLEFSLNLERKLYKLYYYAHLKLDQDTTNTNYQELSGKINNLLQEYDELSSFSNPELMMLDDETIKNYIKENDKLKEYEFYLEKIYRKKNHILSLEEERILSSLSNVINSPEEVFNSLTDSDMKFGFIEDEKLQKVELTESNYNVFLSSNNREIRKNAFEKLLSTYGNYKNTIAKTFSSNVESLTTLSKLRGFNNSLEASLFSDNIDRCVYDNLINTVNNHLDVCHKFFKLKKEKLKLDEFHLYDQYVELTDDCEKEYSFEEAKEMVIEALSVLGDDYKEILNKAFDERWIDVYNNEGKRSGAYSSGFYDTKPYILLNYEGKMNDVSTLAHELGHSLHTYYSCKNNPYQYSSYTIFVAEVASTVNELLLKLYLLDKTNDIEEKKAILSGLMNLFKSTIYRQVMFAEFERDIHAKRENGEILTHELLSNYYYELNKKYFGKDVIVDELIKYEWERIPHFYYDFYVYKYAIGLSCACYIVDGILNKKQNALENYKIFLTLGGSDYPINELKIASIDVTSSEVIESAIKMFDNFIEQYKNIS